MVKKTVKKMVEKTVKKMFIKRFLLPTFHISMVKTYVF